MATLGYRDPKADPVVRVTTYGGPRDAFVRVVDAAINFGLMQRTIVERVRPALVVESIPMTAGELFERRCRERAARESAT